MSDEQLRETAMQLCDAEDKIDELKTELNKLRRIVYTRTALMLHIEDSFPDLFAATQPRQLTDSECDRLSVVICDGQMSHWTRTEIRQWFAGVMG